MRRSSVLLLLLAVVLALPAAATRFDGIPFNTLPEAIVVALLLPLACSTALRRLLDRGVARSSWLPSALFAMVLLAGGLKATLATTRPPGFAACYESTLSAPPAGRCERSFDNPFFRFDATRIDPVLDFGPQDWNLSFVNSLRFNFYPWLRDLRRSDRLPLRIAWRGVVDSGGQAAKVTYVGQGSIGIDATTIDLPGIYDGENTIRFTMPPGRHVVRIYYTFDDGSKTGYRLRLGPYATFRLVTVGEGGKPDRPLTAAAPPTALRAAALLVDVIVAGVSLLLLFLYARLLRFQARRAAIAAGTFAAAWLATRAFGLPVESAAAVVAASLLASVLRRNRSTGLLLAYVVLLLLGAWIALDTYPHLNTVVFRSRGDDWLTYESHARTILETWSLQGGEQVFYNQPFFRYVRFVEHFSLGDGDPLIDTLAWTAFQWSILWAASTLLPGTGIGRARTGLFVVAGALTIVLAGSGTVVAMIRHSLSEHATWIFTAAAFPLLAGRRANRWIFGAALLGAAVITRPNQLPALFAIAVAFLLPGLWRHWRPALVAAVVFVVVSSLALAHNVYYGGQPVIFTTTADNPATLGIPLSTLARIPGDEKARAAVVRDVRGLLFLPPWDTPIRNGELEFALHGLQIVWIVTLFLALRRSPLPWKLRILAVVPLLYLAVHVIYDVGSYYPRHILAAYFVMGFVTMAIAAQAPEPRRRQESEGTRRPF